MTSGAEQALQTFGNARLEGILQALTTNYIRNCLVTLDDAKRTLHIYGLRVAHLRGITVQTKPEKIEMMDLVPIPRQILKAQKFINLFVNYFFVQGLPVLHTISRNIHFRTIELLMNKNKASEQDPTKAVLRVLQMYRKQELQVSQINGDNEFKNTEDTIRPTRLQIVGAGEHVGDMEHSVRTLKERTRYHIHRLPYKRYPMIMVAGMILHITKSLNNFLSIMGIKLNMSPASIVTGCASINFNSIMKLNFRNYAQVHEISHITNGNKPRTIGPIALYPRSDTGWYLMSLELGEKIHRYKMDIITGYRQSSTVSGKFWQKIISNNI